MRLAVRFDHRVPPLRAALSIVAVALLLALAIPGRVAAQEVPELQITSTNYILVDADTGEIYAQRGAHEHRAPASLTKIFTAIESIEDAGPNVMITTTADDFVSDEASQVGFGAGETFTVEELLYGMMLPSGNDAARALARGLGAEPGDTAEQARQRFLDRLNQRIVNMGLRDTHLVDPDGWGVPGHFSSPYDLAAFTMYALKYPRFVQTFSTLTYDTADGSYEFRNNNRMLRTYDGIIGGKTGYDDDAGWCLVNVAQRGGHRMIAVTMNGVAPDDWYDDNRVLLDYGFQQAALRDQNGGITGEIVRYRDPDAARILTIAKASGFVGSDVAPKPAAPVKVEPAPPIIADIDEPKLIPVPAAAFGVGGAGLLGAAATAAALIALKGIMVWRVSAPADAASAASSLPSRPISTSPGIEQLAEAEAVGGD
jgi:D-alanyl-D-alanine carboxypeptidase (penicillin-binding protein 5/6)